MIALCLQQVLGERITQVTLIDPVIVSVLRESAEDAALLVMENQYETFMALREKPDAAAKFFVDLWSGRGVWEQMGQQSRILVASLVPTIAREMTAARLDRSTLAWLTELAGPTTIVVGENTLLPARATTRLLAGARKIKPIEIGGAGHMIPLTHPHDATAAILESAAAC
jgi:pimeloyl-ACP methyl ester carboxylesterase